MEGPESPSASADLDRLDIVVDPTIGNCAAIMWDFKRLQKAAHGRSNVEENDCKKTAGESEGGVDVLLFINGYASGQSGPIVIAEVEVVSKHTFYGLSYSPTVQERT